MGGGAAAGSWHIAPYVVTTLSLPHLVRATSHLAVRERAREGEAQWRAHGRDLRGRVAHADRVVFEVQGSALYNSSSLLETCSALDPADDPWAVEEGAPPRAGDLGRSRLKKVTRCAQAAVPWGSPARLAYSTRCCRSTRHDRGAQRAAPPSAPLAGFRQEARPHSPFQRLLSAKSIQRTRGISA